jgi:hypothetical protein
MRRPLDIALHRRICGNSFDPAPDSAEGGKPRSVKHFQGYFIKIRRMHDGKGVSYGAIKTALEGSQVAIAAHPSSSDWGRELHTAILRR